MARETRVGLLAGLAFIICFAIILANRGRPVPVATYPSVPINPAAVGQRGSGYTTPTASTKTLATTHPPKRRTEPSPGPPIAHRPEPSQPASLPLVHVPTSGAEVALANPTDNTLHLSRAGMSLSQNHRETGMRPGQGRRETSFGNGSMPAGAVTGNASTSPAQEQAGRRRELEARLDALTLGPDTPKPSPPATHQAAVPASRPAASLVEARTTARPSRRHTVASGDTLTRIAAAHYESRSRRAVSAIFDANRSVLSSPDKLQVGMELTLPVLDEATEAADLRATSNPTTSRITDASATPRVFRWYQVQKGDRYHAIARDQLGDGRRWREIYELNRDKFPDPHRIRHGVRIKVPTNATSRSVEAGP